MKRILAAATPALAVLVALSIAVVPPQPAHAASTDWPTYLGDPGRSGYESGELFLSPQTAPSLSTRWTLKTGAPISDQPIESGGLVYWGSWNGTENATTTSGKTVWSTFVGITSTGPQCMPSQVGVASTATVGRVAIHGTQTPVLWVGGGDASMYALNAQTGKVIWTTGLGALGSAFIWASPLYYKGSVYIGLSSFGDCPLVQGELLKLNASTGHVTATFKAAPDGCVGDGIWGSPTLDARAGSVYVVTGNDGSCSEQEVYSESMVEVNTADLSVIGFWPIPAFARGGDSDFGSTPTLFRAQTPSGVEELVGAVNKNGIYYAFKRGDVSAGPVWQRRIASGGSSPQDGGGAISPSAWDGARLYVAGGKAGVSGHTCAGALRALNPLTGTPIWSQCLPAPVLGAVTLAPGIAEVGCGPRIIVVRTADGKILYNTVFAKAEFWGPGSIADGTLYQGDMSGRLYALSPVVPGS